MLENVKKKHILRALKEIDRGGIPPEHKTKKYRYFLEHKGKRYPNKYVSLLANKFAGGSISRTKEFGSRKSRKYLEINGFKILDEKLNAENKIAQEDDESAFPEGAERYRSHRTRERDTKIVKRAKAKRKKETGKLVCDVCSMNFEEMYGSLGEGFIEAHHTVPVRELDGLRNTKLSEIALVCSNCHRMLHRGKKLKSIEQTRRTVRNNLQNSHSKKKR